MNLKLKLIALAGIVLFSFSNVKAQTTNQVQTVSQSRLDAAVAMLHAVGIDKQFDNMMNNMVAVSSNQVPEGSRPGFAKVMKTFMGKYFTWDLLKNKMAAIYAEEFNEDELNQITAFYNSPIGQKVSSRLPSLMQKAMMVGQESVASHKDELEQMMQDELGQTDPPNVQEQVSPAPKKATSKTPAKH